MSDLKPVPADKRCPKCNGVHYIPVKNNKLHGVQR